MNLFSNLIYLFLFYFILYYFGVVTLYLTTFNRTTVKRQQFIGQQLTGAAFKSITFNNHGRLIGTNNKGKPLFIEILNMSKSAAIAAELHDLFYFILLLYHFNCIFILI